MIFPTPDPLERFIIPTQEWETFTPQTLEQIRDADAIEPEDDG